MQEIDFESDFKIGKFNAFDYFGDGSFYLLDVPGHAIGHMCGLVRTTSTSFILLGADSCHFAGTLVSSYLFRTYQIIRQYFVITLLSCSRRVQIAPYSAYHELPLNTLTSWSASITIYTTSSFSRLLFRT